MFKKTSAEIAPAKCRATDWDWRLSLKPGDQVDAVSSQGHWLLATIVERAGEEVTVGFRVYTDENAYEGYDAKHDEKVSIHSIRIQKPKSISKEGTIYCSSYLDKEFFVPEDSSDILLNSPVAGDSIYLVHRPGKCSSSFYLSLMNDFGKNKGFDCIINRCKDFAVTMQEVIDSVDILSAPNNLYHRNCITSHLKPFTEFALAYTKQVPEAQLRNVQRRECDRLVTRLELLGRRVFTARSRGEELTKLKVGLAMKLLRFESLELRIEAVSLVAGVFAALKNYQVSAYHAEAYINIKTLVRSLVDVPRMVEEVFGKRSHLELIRRSTETLRVFLVDQDIGRSELATIWSCCSNEQSKIEVLKVLSEAASLLSKQTVELIAEKYRTIPKESLRDQDVLMLGSLLERSIKVSPVSLQKIIEIAWQVANNKLQGISPQARREATNRFCRAIAQSDTQVLENWLAQLYAMLEKGESVKLVLKVLRTALSQLQTLPGCRSKAEMVLGLLGKGNVVKNFFAGIVQYTQTTSRLNLDREEHEEQLNERIEFLQFIIRVGNYRLSMHNLETLWTNFVVAPVLAEDQVVLYKFLSNLMALGKLETSVASMNDLSAFFTNTICSGDFQDLPLEGMGTIESLLVLVNKSAGLLESAKKTKSPLWRQIRSNIFKQKLPEDDFIVKAKPDNVKGIDILWKIVLECRREGVTLKAMELLSKLYTRLAASLDCALDEIAKEFVETATEKLSLFYQKAVQGNENRDKEIVTLIRLIEEMLDESERKGMWLSKDRQLLYNSVAWSVKGNASNSSSDK